MHLMIDIETLGVSVKAPVISIGAVLFNEDGLHDSFTTNLSLKDQIDNNIRLPDASTIMWWMSQEDGAKKVFKESTTPTKEGLERFIEFFHKAQIDASDDIKVWASGPSFDVSILESILSDYKLKVPWKYNAPRDLRTFRDLIYDGSDMERVGTHHNALDDAKYQAQVIIEGLKRKAVVDKKPVNTCGQIQQGDISRLAILTAEIRRRLF